LETSHGKCNAQASCRLWYSKKASPYLNSHALQILNYSMIQSHFLYCISTWCNGNRITLLKLQRMANKFIRMIHNLDYRASVKEVMHSNGLLTIETACFMFRYQNNCLPSAFSDLLKQNNLCTENIQTRRSKSKNFPKFLSY